jgi:hypothetical protein
LLLISGAEKRIQFRGDVEYWRAKGQNMQDRTILDHIGDLVAEEHALLEKADQNPQDPTVHEDLAKLQVTLDQCWDLLRQRRARREFQQNPDDAKVRDPGTVEEYKQ